jgi:mono/diheme cytochrome c family protein
MHRTALLALLLAAASQAAASAAGLSPEAQRGFVFVRTNCSMCHAVGPVGDSPLPVAPRFRDLHLRYPVENLAEALAEGIVTGHPSMPEFRLEPDQVADVIAYLKTLETP